MVIHGRSRDDLFGWQIRSGDINGDQIVDLIITARYGEAWSTTTGVAFGITGPFKFGDEITIPEKVALTLRGSGSQTDQLGTYLDTGDLNGDGLDDIIVGSLDYTFVYLGSRMITATQPLTVSISPENVALTIIQAGPLVCNINGDLFDDLIFQSLTLLSPHHVWGILGGSHLSMTNPITIDLNTDPIELYITGFNPVIWEEPLIGNMGCGDVDGDGIDDLVYGSYSEPNEGGDNVGKVYVFRGRHEITYTQSLTLVVPQDADAILEGIDGKSGELGDSFGRAVRVGDANGDGLADLVIGAPTADGVNNDLNDAGEVYLWLGRELAGQIANIASEAEWIIYGSREYVDLNPAAMGDYDGDNRQEALLSCPVVLDEALYAGRGGCIVNAEEFHGPQFLTDVVTLIVGPPSGLEGIGSSSSKIDIDNDGATDPIFATENFGETAEDVYIISYPDRHRLYFPTIWER